MVGASSSEVSGISLPNRRSIRANRLTARSDVPPSSKKLSTDPHRLDPQQVGPDPGQRRFDLGARGAPAAGCRPAEPAGAPIGRGSPRGPARASPARRRSARTVATCGRPPRRRPAPPRPPTAPASIRRPRPHPPGDRRRPRPPPPGSRTAGPPRSRAGRPRRPFEEVARRLVLLGEEDRRVDPRQATGPGDLPQLPSIRCSTPRPSTRQLRRNVSTSSASPRGPKIMAPTRP